MQQVGMMHNFIKKKVWGLVSDYKRVEKSIPNNFLSFFIILSYFFFKSFIRFSYFFLSFSSFFCFFFHSFAEMQSNINNVNIQHT